MPGTGRMQLAAHEPHRVNPPRFEVGRGGLLEQTLQWCGGRPLAKASQREMRMESGAGVLGDFGKRPGDLGLETDEGGDHSAEPEPKNPGAAQARKNTQFSELQGKRGRGSANPVEALAGLHDLIRREQSEESQGQVQLPRLGPAHSSSLRGAGQMRVKPDETLRDGRVGLDRNETAD